MTNQANKHNNDNRRDFLRESLLLAAIPVGLVGSIAQAGSQTFANLSSGELRIGLLGCGRRGLQLTQAALACAPNSRLVALADVFPDRIQQTYRTLNSRYSEQLQLNSTSRFIGMRACEQLAASDVDAVIVAASPGSRPAQVKLLTQAGKHVYVESPLATDQVGAQEVAQTIQQAIDHRLSVCCGLQHRMQPFYQTLVDNLHSGLIGSMLFGRVSVTGAVEPSTTHNKSKGDFEWRLRNWQLDRRFGGHPIVQNLTGHIDLLNWIMGDTPSLNSASQNENGFELELSYTGSVRVQCQVASTASSSSGSAPKFVCQLQGTQGWCDLISGRIYDQTNRLIASTAGSPHDFQPVLKAWVASIACRSGDELLQRQVCLAQAASAATHVALQAQSMLETRSVRA